REVDMAYSLRSREPVDDVLRRLAKKELRSARDGLLQARPRIRRDVRILHDAETALGDDHNIVVLCAELSKAGSLCDLERLRRAADQYQRSLRRKAIADGRRIYKDKPRNYVRRVKRAWKVWQRLPAGARH